MITELEAQSETLVASGETVMNPLDLEEDFLSFPATVSRIRYPDKLVPVGNRIAMSAAVVLAAGNNAWSPNANSRYFVVTIGNPTSYENQLFRLTVDGETVEGIAQGSYTINYATLLIKLLTDAAVTTLTFYNDGPTVSQTVTVREYAARETVDAKIPKIGIQGSASVNIINRPSVEIH